MNQKYFIIQYEIFKKFYLINIQFENKEIKININKKF